MEEGDPKSELEALREEMRAMKRELRQMKGLPPDEMPPRSQPTPPPWVDAVPPKAAPAATTPPAPEPAVDLERLKPKPQPQPQGDASSPDNPFRIKRGPLANAPRARPQAAALAATPAARTGLSAAIDERFIGEKLLQYVGMLLLGLGVVFFLVWQAKNHGPMAKVVMAAGAGAALIRLARFVQKRPPYDRMANVLAGGGWSILYITAYASYHFPLTRVVTSPVLAMALLVAAAAGMIAHAVRSRSRPLRIYAFGLTYLLLGFCREEVISFDLFLLLQAASAAVAAWSGEADVLIVSLLGFYGHYFPVYWDTIHAPAVSRSLAAFLQPFGWLAGGYLIVALLPFVPRARRALFSEEQAKIADAALCLNIAVFFLLGAAMGRIYFGEPSMTRAAAVAAFLALPAAGYALVLPRRTAAIGAGGAAALWVLAMGVFQLPDPQMKLLAWVLISSAWVWMGLFLELPAWRAAGMFMSMLTFFFYYNLVQDGLASRKAAAMSMFVFAATSYFFSRFYRVWLDAPEEWETAVSEYWLYAGTAGLVLGLWGALDSAPFACALLAAATAGEFCARRLGRAHLWVQASAAEVFVGFYSFFIDYGSGSALGVPPRLLVSALISFVFAALFFADPMDETVAEKWNRWSQAEQRRVLSWLMTAVAVFAVYKSFDGRLRLPIWALGVLGLYWAGRATKHKDLRRQSGLLAVGVMLEAIVSYLFAPAALMATLTVPRAALYWTGVAALLGGMHAAKTGAGDDVDTQSAATFSLLALVLGAAYLGKELDSVKLTLAWTALGISFLGSGLLLDWKELRLPGLGLLGLCVGKALLMDTSQLPLPYRVASFMALGAVLLAASGLYVRAGAKRDA
ncbi:MAG TPA: DUF2339 domain-containing protein [Elusimicrobiota bacterium]|nr:DUF2339 domain-containing protein [Elusimicrobiota bacterium]